MSIGYNGEVFGRNDSTTTTVSHGWQKQSVREPVRQSERQVLNGRYPGSSGHVVPLRDPESDHSLVKFRAERRFRKRQYGPREGVLVLTGRPRPLIEESCTTSIKDFSTFSSSSKRKGG